MIVVGTVSVGPSSVSYVEDVDNGMRELTWDSDCIDDCCGSDNGDRARWVGDRGGYC